MAMNCTRCQGCGFLNTHQLSEELQEELDEIGAEEFYEKHKKLICSEKNDIQVCDCCGDGESWHDIPGEHYNQDKPGRDGIYGYNGGYSECH